MFDTEKNRQKFFNKIIFFLFTGMYDMGIYDGLPPLLGHSLSWEDNKKLLRPNQTLTAKIWTPAVPSREEVINCYQSLPDNTLDL